MYIYYNTQYGGPTNLLYTVKKRKGMLLAQSVNINVSMYSKKINPILSIVGTLYIDTLIFTNYARNYARNIPLRFFTVQSKFVGPPYYVL